MNLLSIINLTDLNVDTLVLMFSTLVFVLMMFKWHSDNKIEFDLRYAFVDDTTGKMSLSKFGQLVALATSTWVVIYETRHTRLSEWLFGAYILTWAGANSLNKYLKSKEEK